MQSPSHKQSFLVVLLFLPIGYILLRQNEEYFVRTNVILANTNNVVNYSLERNSLLSLSDVKRSKSNIFFIESRCATEKLAASFDQTGRFLLNPRQCCAVESAATSNPDRPVYILHTCPLDQDFIAKAPSFSKKLLANNNVYVVRYNMSEFFADTPVEDLAHSRRLQKTQYPVEHASDVLRITTLWRFGGTYLDLDVITLKSFKPLGNNFCAMEKESVYMGSAVLNFEPEDRGHTLLTVALQYLNQHFDGVVWTANGPDLITELVTDECGDQIEMLSGCTTFTVFDHSYFYPVLYWNYTNLFNPSMGPAVAASIKKTAYVLHTWNKVTKSIKVRVGSPQAYGLLADEFCHDVYNNCGDEF